MGSHTSRTPDQINPNSTDSIGQDFKSKSTIVLEVFIPQPKIIIKHIPQDNIKIEELTWLKQAKVQ